MGLLDADAYGPNVPGDVAEPKMLDEKTMIPVQAYGVKIISMVCWNPGDSCSRGARGRRHTVMQQFLRSVRWGQLDLPGGGFAA